MISSNQHFTQHQSSYGYSRPSRSSLPSPLPASLRRRSVFPESIDLDPERERDREVERDPERERERDPRSERDPEGDRGPARDHESGRELHGDRERDRESGREPETDSVTADMSACSLRRIDHGYSPSQQYLTGYTQSFDGGTQHGHPGPGRGELSYTSNTGWSRTPAGTGHEDSHGDGSGSSSGFVSRKVKPGAGRNLYGGLHVAGVRVTAMDTTMGLWFLFTASHFHAHTNIHKC